MKIVIRTEGSRKGEEAVLVNAFGWRINSRQILMIRGLVDGYYNFSVDTVVVPREIWHRDDHVLVYVDRTEDIAVLASDLRRGNQFAHDSFLDMRT